MPSDSLNCATSAIILPVKSLVLFFSKVVFRDPSQTQGVIRVRVLTYDNRISLVSALGLRLRRVALPVQM